MKTATAATKSAKPETVKPATNRPRLYGDPVAEERAKKKACSQRAQPQSPQAAGRGAYPLRLSKEQRKQINDAAALSGLGFPAIARMSIRAGLPIIRQRLLGFEGKAAAK